MRALLADEHTRFAGYCVCCRTHQRARALRKIHRSPRPDAWHAVVRLPTRLIATLRRPHELTKSDNSELADALRTIVFERLRSCSGRLPRRMGTRNWLQFAHLIEIPFLLAVRVQLHRWPFWRR